MPEPGAARALTVSELTARIKRTLEETLEPVRVEGEISNFHRHSSGHLYFTLKDSGACLSCVMFRSAAFRLRFAPTNGLCVQAEGRITVYERQGQYQLLAERMMPAGVGALQQAFEALKRKLEAEGLFDKERKRPLPRHPERIGLVTSPRGAAIRDLLTVLRRRWPGLAIVVRPVPVQGEGAAAEIARAIDEMNAYGEIDLLIVGRGGGSVEDLWAFNEEAVARAIHRSRVPVISAVGHEIDITIADYVADMRAPTPTGAAEIAVRDRDEARAGLAHLTARLERDMRRTVDRGRSRLDGVVASYGFRRTPDRLAQSLQRLDDGSAALARAIRSVLDRARESIASVDGRLNPLHPAAVLARGYCICRAAVGGIVRSAASLSIGETVSLEFAAGKARAEVTAKEEDDARSV